MIESAPFAVQLVNETAKTIYVNGLFLEYFNFTCLEECTYINILERHTPTSYTAQLERERVQNSNNKEQTYTISILSKDDVIKHLVVFRLDKLVENELTTLLIYQDITTQEEKNATLADSERSYKELFMLNPAGIMLIEQSTGRLLDMNQAAEKLFSSSLYPLNKGKDHEFENLTLFLTQLRQVGFGKTTEPIKISLGLNGHPRTFEVRAESLCIKSQMVQAIFVMDVSHEESWNAHTVACSATLLKSKKELIDCVAHEVRTPLNRIVGFSSLLKDTTLSPLERERYFNEVMEGSNQLLNTINNLIKITITQAKLSDHDYKDIDINKLIESVSTQS